MCYAENGGPFPAALTPVYDPAGDGRDAIYLADLNHHIGVHQVKRSVERLPPGEEGELRCASLIRSAPSGKVFDMVSVFLE